MTDAAETVGAPWVPWDAVQARRWIRVPDTHDDKYSRGVLGIMTGSRDYPGAAVLGVEGAARTGIGMVRYLGPGRATRLVLERRPEVVSVAGRVQAWLVGSGMDAAARGDGVTRQLRDALGQGVPVVIDAGALDLTGAASGPVILTPHSRELARLLQLHGLDVQPDSIDADPAGWTITAAEKLGVAVLLKGHVTHVAGGKTSTLPHRITIASGHSWLATAGTGDVLGGILGALVATNATEIAEDPSILVPLAATASFIHGLAAERASQGGPIVALDVAEALPATIRALLTA